MTNDHDQQVAQQMQLEQAKARAKKYMAELRAKWGQSLGSFIHGSVDQNDRVIRAQAALSVATDLQQAAIIEAMAAGIHYGSITQVIGSSLTQHGKEHLDAAMRQQLMNDPNLRTQN
jgi:hypothetical protein